MSINNIECPSCGHAEELSENEMPEFDEFIEWGCEKCSMIFKVGHLSQGKLLLTDTGRKRGGSIVKTEEEMKERLESLDKELIKIAGSQDHHQIKTIKNEKHTLEWVLGKSNKTTCAWIR